MYIMVMYILLCAAYYCWLFLFDDLCKSCTVIVKVNISSCKKRMCIYRPCVCIPYISFGPRSISEAHPHLFRDNYFRTEIVIVYARDFYRKNMPESYRGCNLPTWRSGYSGQKSWPGCKQWRTAVMDLLGCRQWQAGSYIILPIKKGPMRRTGAAELWVIDLGHNIIFYELV